MKIFKNKIVRALALFLFKITFFLSCISVVLFYSIYVYIDYTNPDIARILEENSQQKVDILYSNNFEKIKSYNSGSFTNFDYDELPSHLINALVSTEDKGFFEHGGLSYLGIMRAFFVNLRAGYIKQGGSTITQQLAKMILKDNSRTFKRKFKELIMTRKIEKHLTKQDILVFYLNMSYFGNGKYGISNASDYYFGKNVSDLTLEESAMLVGLLKAPSKYNPTKDEELTKNRTKQVILNMKNNGFINDDDVISYLVPSLDLDKYKISDQKKQNFYFSDYAFKQVKNLDLDKNFLNLSVITTLNKYIQEHVIKTIQLFIEHNAIRLDKSEIAVVVMKKDGEILSMVGGRDYSQSQFNRVTSAKRQIGSLFKLFIYLAALENNLELRDVFMDEKIKIGDWYPENNDGVYRGRITVKDAFAISSNSVAVQIADYFGIDETIRMCNKLGIVDEYKNDYSILLGTRESTLFDIVNAYATIVNDGKPVSPHVIKYILNNNNVIYKTDTDEKASIFKENTIKNMQYLLYTVVTEGTAKGAKIRELIEKTEEYNRDNRKKKYFIGGKTGTTQNNRDAWFIGFANDYVIGVWIGNDDNTPTNKVTGGNLPVMLWKDIMLGII